MKRIGLFFTQHKYLYMAALLIPLLVWFKIIEATLTPKYIIQSPLDYKIPFIKEFVVPYILWFGYVAYGIVYTALHSKQDFYKLLIFLGGGMAICYIIYMLFPNAQDLRPVITGDDIFSKLVKIIYLTDTPTNVCPSIHVLNSIGVDAALRNSAEFSSKKYGRMVSAVLAVSISLSTVFIKQHSVIDVVYGAILGTILYVLIYAIPNIRQLLQNTEGYSFKEILKAAVNY